MSNTVIIREDGNWYSVKEICEICGVDEKTFRRFLEEIRLDIDVQTEIRTLAHNKKLYSEGILKKFQAWLMRNQINQGKSSQVVKAATNSAFDVGISLQVIIESGNEEAFNEYMGMARKSLVAQRNLKLEQQKNQQLQLENKQLANENNYLKKVNEINTAQLGYYTNRYHSWQDDYENY